MTRVWHTPLIVLTTAAILILTPFVFCFFVGPLLIYRLLLSVVYKRKNPGSCGILSAHSSLFYTLAPATHDAHHGSPGGRRRWECSNADQLMVVVNVKLEGPTLDIDAFQSLVVTQVVYAKKEGGGGGCGRLLHPELQQYPELWRGYLFWKQDPTFEVRNHIKVCNSGGLNRDKFMEEYRKQTLPADRSPWELTVVENRREGNENEQDEPCTYTLILFKFAHYLADGYSIFNTVTRLVDGGGVQRYEPKLPGRAERFMEGLLYPLWGPYEFVAWRFRAELTKQGLFAGRKAAAAIVSDTESSGTTEWSLAWAAGTRPPSLSWLQATAKRYQVSVTCVMLVSYARALGKHLTSTTGQMDNCRYLNLSIPLPAPNHAKGITNDIYLAMVSIPMNGPTLEAQLRECEAELRRVKRSTIPATMAHLWSLIGITPVVSTWKWALFGRLYHGDGNIAVFPGPTTEFKIMGRKVVELSNFTLPPQPWFPRPGVVSSVLTYNGRIHLWVSATPDVATIDQVRALVAAVEHEMGEQPDLTRIDRF